MSKTRQGSNCGKLDKATKHAWKSNKLKQTTKLCGSKATMACKRVVSELILTLWEEVLWLFLDAWDNKQQTTQQLNSGTTNRDKRAKQRVQQTTGDGATMVNKQLKQLGQQTTNNMSSFNNFMMLNKPTFVQQTTRPTNNKQRGWFSGQQTTRTEVKQRNNKQANNKRVRTTWVMATLFVEQHRSTNNNCNSSTGPR